MDSKHETNLKFVAICHAFAVFCGYPPGTPIADIIGQPAIDLIVSRARKWLLASALSFALWFVAGFSAIRFLIELRPSAGSLDSPYHLSVAAMSSLLAWILLRTRHEPSQDELLKTARTEDHRRGIAKLEEFLDLAGTKDMPAVENVPERPVDLASLPQVSNALFRSDNGRLLLVRPNLFWLVRNRLRKPVAPILVRFDASKYLPSIPGEEPSDALPATDASAPSIVSAYDEPKLSWLVPLDADEIKEWHADYWLKRPQPSHLDDPERDLVIYTCANTCVLKPRHKSLRELADHVLSMAQQEGTPIGLSNETITKMLGWTQSKQHRNYTGFRDYAVDRLKREGRWPPRAPGEQLLLFQARTRLSDHGGGSPGKPK